VLSTVGRKKKHEKEIKAYREDDDQEQSALTESKIL
jgi:hypothetical protein